ncbi:MAG: alpha/beta hydrolase [Firmicutes bacterium]|nr:alpha/beta hydrolase [Bacillota bacterium]
MLLDPQVYAFYEKSIESRGFMPPALDFSEMRKAADAAFNDKTQILPVYRWEDVKTEEGLRLRVYTPHRGLDPEKGRKLPGGNPVLMYFHGGGFIMHNVESHDALCRKLAVTLGACVVSVDYRLAPEHPYPAAVEDAEKAWRWIRESAAARDWDPQRIYAGGDSAGATISAALALKLRDRGEENLKGLLLLYGSYHAAEVMETESGRAFTGGDYVLPREMLEYCEKLHEGEDTDPMDPYYAPGRETRWEGFPPCVMVHAGCDPLRDDGKAFGKLLRDAGVPVQEITAEGMMHGFALYWWRFRRAEEILLEACRALISLG